MKIKTIKRISKEKTYDLSIQDNHNYFVGRSELLVHNSGKDAIKVDRSAAYFSRWVALKALSNFPLINWVKIKVAYSIGISHPLGIDVECDNPTMLSKLNEFVNTFDFRPAAIIERLDLKKPIYKRSTNYGHYTDQSLSWNNLEGVHKSEKV